VIVGDLVVAGDYNLIAFDRGTGAMRWRFTPSDGYGPGISLGSGVNGRVFTGSPAGRVYAIDARSGTLGWSVVVANDDQTTVYQPASDGSIVVAGYTTFGSPSIGGVVAIDPDSGRERWRARFPRPEDPSLDTNSAGQLVLADDVVIAPSGDGVIYAFDRASGSIRWSIPRLTGSIEGIITATDREYRALTRSERTLVAGSLTGYVVAVDLDTRQERWRYAGGYNGSTAYRLSSDGRVVYVPYVSGFLVAIDLARGVEIWRTRDWQAGFLYPPAIAGDTLHLGGASAGFYALSAATGGGR
jgi:outer membrane protein assembly factor BamB